MYAWPQQQSASPVASPRQMSTPYAGLYGNSSGSGAYANSSGTYSGYGGYNSGAYGHVQQVGASMPVSSAWPSQISSQGSPTKPVKPGLYTTGGFVDHAPSPVNEYRSGLGFNFSGQTGAAQTTTSPSGSQLFKTGDHVEIWSNSQNAWCRGTIDRTEGDLVSVKYIGKDCHYICKVMPNGDPSIRLVQGNSQPSGAMYFHFSPAADDLPETTPSGVQAYKYDGMMAPNSNTSMLPAIHRHNSIEDLLLPHSNGAGAEEAEVARSLDAYQKHVENRECADCGAPSPEWASLQHGTLLCLDCAGVHRCCGFRLKSLSKPEFWTAAEASALSAHGGNMKVNRRLAEQVGLSVPRPPPDTDRYVIERYIIRKYRANPLDIVDSYMASQELVRELNEEIERKRLAKEKAEREARLAKEKAEREAREAAERARREREEKIARERAAKEQAERAAREQAERAVREQERAAAAAAAASAAAALRPGGFREAHSAPPPIDQSRIQQPAIRYHDPSGAGQDLPGLVVVDIVAVNLVNERARDLRYMGAWFLDLTVSISLGKITSIATPNRKGSANVRWEPPEQRELRWDCKERWLWCRVDDNLIGGNKQVAGVGLVDVRAAQAEAAEMGQGAKVAEMELELLAKEPNMKPDLQKNRSAADPCWQLAVGHYGPPGPPGGHGHYVFEQVEDLDHVTHGETCGTVILRITVMDPLGGPGIGAHSPVAAIDPHGRGGMGAHHPGAATPVAYAPPAALPPVTTPVSPKLTSRDAHDASGNWMGGAQPPAGVPAAAPSGMHGPPGYESLPMRSRPKQGGNSQRHS